MQRYEPSLLAVAVCLAALAGFVDALAFTSLGGFFASFMSGNLTRLGVALGNGASGDVSLAVALILSFVSGVILAAVIARAAVLRALPMLMGGVAGLLFVAALVGEILDGPLASLLLAAAMGVMHLLLRRTGDAVGGGLLLTGSLVRLGEAVADAMMGGPDRWRWLPDLLLCSVFVAGAVMGVEAFFGMALRALWFAALAAGVLTCWFTVRLRSAKIPG